MKIEIDQSGKIENTNRLSILAFSNDINKSLLITSRDKKIVQSIFRRVDQPRVFISKVFVAAIFYLIKDDFHKIDTIIIDKEYPGHEEYIKQSLLEILNKNGFNIKKVNIYFRSIGKKSRAHDIAWHAFKKRQALMKISAKQIIQLIFG